MLAKPDNETPSVHSEPQGDRLLKFFSYDHLHGEALAVSTSFHEMVCAVAQNIEPGPERTAGLRKLLEAKDCLVRAAIYPGG